MGHKVRCGGAHGLLLANDLIIRVDNQKGGQDFQSADRINQRGSVTVDFVGKLETVLVVAAGAMFIRVVHPQNTLSHCSELSIQRVHLGDTDTLDDKVLEIERREIVDIKGEEATGRVLDTGGGQVSSTLQELNVVFVWIKSKTATTG